MAGRVWSREDRPTVDRGRDCLALGRTAETGAEYRLVAVRLRRQALEDRFRHLEPLERCRWSGLALEGPNSVIRMVWLGNAANQAVQAMV